MDVGFCVEFDVMGIESGMACGFIKSSCSCPRSRKYNLVQLLKDNLPIIKSFT